MAELFFATSIKIKETNGFEIEFIEEQLEVAVYETLDELGVPYSVNSFGISDASLATRIKRPDENSLGGIRKGDPSTSAKAAQDNYPRSGSQRWKVLLAIAANNGAIIAEEVAEITGIEYRSVTPRIGELKKGGWVHADGRSRKGSMGSDQVILSLTEKGERYVSHKEGAQITDSS